MALINSTSKNSTSTPVTTDPIDTTGGTFIIAFGSVYYGSTAFTDSKGNTWQPLTQIVTHVDFFRLRFVYCIDPIVGTGHTFTLSTHLQGTIIIAVFDDLIEAFDVENGFSQTTNTTSIQPGSVTPISNDLIITGVLNGVNSGVSIGSGFTEILDVAATPALGGALAYKLSSSSENPTWTIPNQGATSGVGAIIAAFTIAAPEPPTITTTTLPDGTIDEAYSETLAATGGTGAITWSIDSGALPDGLALNSSTGEISGTPTTLGTASFTVEAEDSSGSSPYLTNLISYWNLDEASGNALDAHGSNDLTDTNTVGSAAGKVGNARDFENASSEYFIHADNADLSMGDIDFTFACWVNFESLDDTRNIIGKADPVGGVYEYLLHYRASLSQVAFFVSPNGSASVTMIGSATPTVSTWYYVVAWHDATADTINLQLNNGTVYSTAHTTGVFNGTADFSIGLGLAGTSMDGLIDEVGLWKRTLTTDERTYLYNSGAGRSYADLAAAVGGGATDTQALSIEIVEAPDVFGNYEVLQMTPGLRLESITWAGAVLRASFGRGFGAKANVGGVEGLHRWSLHSGGIWWDGLDDMTIDGVSRFEYYWEFFKAHTTGAEEIFVVEWRGRYFHAQFADVEMSVEKFKNALVYQGGFEVIQRRIAGASYMPDGSINLLSLDLISWWKLDEASGDALDAHGTNDLTDTNTVGSAAGKVGNARDFEATNSEKFTIADNADLSTGNTDFTLGGWVNFESFTGFQSLFSKWGDAAGTHEYTCYYDSVESKIAFGVSHDGTTSALVYAGSAPTLATWHFVIAWHDSAADTINIQIDNGAVYSASHSLGVLNGSTAFTLGAGDVGTGFFLDGMLDEVFFYKRILTGTERSFLYNDGAGVTYEDFT